MSDVVKQPCGYCFSAFVCDELTPDNDLSYMGVGSSTLDTRFMIRSGWGKPVAILFESLSPISRMWGTTGVYIPKFCPECGRELHENKKFLEKKG